LSFPFFDAIKGTTSGTPGTGSFTPNAAAPGFRAWSNVPSGWIGLVRYEDGSSWELRYGYWNATAISRPTNGFHSSSSGSGLTLTSAATAALVMAADMIQPNPGVVPTMLCYAVNGLTTRHLLGVGSANVSGTAGAAFIGESANALGRQIRTKYTSATTANAQCGLLLDEGGTSSGLLYYSTTAGAGGFSMAWSFGASQIPTSPRLYMGVSSTSFVGNTGNPSAFADYIAGFIKDSGDTNFQFMTKDGATANKQDCGFALTANGWYRAAIWALPGGGRIYGLLIRIDSGDIWFGSSTSNLLLTATTYYPQVLGGLSSSTGTAMIFHIGNICLRTEP
jgi:hypothetical protein